MGGDMITLQCLETSNAASTTFGEDTDVAGVSKKESLANPSIKFPILESTTQK